MKDGEVIAYFDRRPTAEITIHAVWDIPRMADMAYEFGYVLCRVSHWQGTTRLVFERDDTDHARRRAEWSVNYYRAYGRWGRQQPQFQLPGYMGRRIEPLEAAQARYALALFRNKAWAIGMSALMAVLIAIIVWHLRGRAEVIVPILLVGIPFVLMRRYLTLAAQQASQAVSADGGYVRTTAGG